MHALARSTPRAIPGRTIDALDLAPGGGVSRGLIRVDLHDPAFFDHPLDHVPGMLLVVAGLELAEHAAMLRPANVSLRLTFTKFCELDAPVEVSATRETGGNPIEFIQSGRSIARGLLGRRETTLPAELAPVPAFGNGSIPSELVHRADPANIAARQFGIAILHLWGQQPMETKMIFVGLTADVPTGVPQSHMKRALSWRPTPPEQTRKLNIDVHAVGDRAIKVGSIVIATRCVDEVEYARLRSG